MAGGDGSAGPAGHPAVDVFMVQHAITTGEVPAAPPVPPRCQRGSREPLIASDPGRPASRSPGTDPAALRVITAAVLAAWSSPAAVAAGRAVDRGAAAAPRPAAGAGPAGWPAQGPGLGCSARPPGLPDRALPGRRGGLVGSGAAGIVTSVIRSGTSGAARR